MKIKRFLNGRFVTITLPSVELVQMARADPCEDAAVTKFWLKVKGGKVLKEDHPPKAG